MAWWLTSLPKESTTGLVSATASDRRDLNFDLKHKNLWKHGYFLKGKCYLTLIDTRSWSHNICLLLDTVLIKWHEESIHSPAFRKKAPTQSRVLNIMRSQKSYLQSDGWSSKPSKCRNRENVNIRDNEVPAKKPRLRSEQTNPRMDRDSDLFHLAMASLQVRKVGKRNRCLRSRGSEIGQSPRTSSYCALERLVQFL
jgi:hypothetical protein